MNAPRIAALLRELADAIEEPAPHETRAKRVDLMRGRKRVTSEPDEDLPPITDIDRARARKMLRRLGIETP